MLLSFPLFFLESIMMETENKYIWCICFLISGVEVTFPIKENSLLQNLLTFNVSEIWLSIIIPNLIKQPLLY